MLSRFLLFISFYLSFFFSFSMRMQTGGSEDVSKVTPVNFFPLRRVADPGFFFIAGYGSGYRERICGLYISDPNPIVW